MTEKRTPQQAIDSANIPAEYFRPYAPAAGEGAADADAPAAPARDEWQRFARNKGAVISLFILIFIMLTSAASIWYSPHDPNAQNIPHAFLPPKIPWVEINGFNGLAREGDVWVDRYAEAPVADGVYYLLGTDNFGRDLLSRILFGTRISVLIACVAALLDLTVGVAYGLISGWKGGATDTAMQRILEIVSGVPTLVVVILALLIFPPGAPAIIVAIALTSWISMARVVRAQTLKIKEQEFVLASRALGTSALKIMLRHILPNLSGIIIIQTMFTIPTAIFFEAFLSFIGIGMRAPNASIGTLLNEGYKVFRFYPHLMWYPALIICLLMIGFNLLADGLRDAFDPKMKI
ncbi:ABC transporter permease [Brenneria corticis]|uniref:ABC transporter permease n=1 Tax=Brenneria corticis TaxID=2173106 RepID=A0A2U1U442_9GAMM|nr:ABC transporter permease [Brenneria sp. CFCC 11842]PWC16438.1 ABC transporter permease [Brenneria sp. CFCC 11842]